MEKIIVNSFPEYYEKEKSGIKNNIVITPTKDGNTRNFRLLCAFKNKHINNLQIEIVNSETGESFIRNIRDVSYFKGIYIITWDYKEVA